MPLSDRACQNAKPKAKIYKLADDKGLYLEVKPMGGRYWRLKYRLDGKEKRLAFGVYPEVSLLEARARRDAARKLIADGIDPQEAARDQKEARALRAATTFEMVAREWHGRNLSKWSSNYGQDILHRLEADVFPEIGRKAISELTPLHVLNMLRKIEDRGAHEIVRRTRQFVGQICRYAIQTGRATINPTADLKGAFKTPKREHFAAIEPNELPEFLATLNRNDARLFTQTRLAIRLLLLTFVRTNELIQAKWDEIDLDGAQWLIPAERMKMRRPHIVPLSRQTIAALNELRATNVSSDWVFASSAKPRQHMSNNTILKALERLGYKGRMTGHGFRALAMTAIKEKLGIPHEVVDRQLAHAPRSQVDQAYDRSKFLDQRRRMMQRWADYIDGASEQKVIRFPGAT